MSELRIAAEPRTEFGKGAARRTRRAGKVPAVLYGHGADPRHLSLPARDLGNAIRHSGANVLLTLVLGDGTELALPKAIVRHPIRDEIEHVDLLLVRSGETVTVDVPVIVEGEADRDGIVSLVATTLSLEAEATHIPSSLVVDVSALKVGDAIHAGQVTLPAGSTLAGDPEALVVQVIARPTEAAEAAEGEGEGAEAAAEVTEAAAE